MSKPTVSPPNVVKEMPAFASSANVEIHSSSDQPVELADGQITVNEKILHEGQIYGFKFKDQQYHVQKTDGTTRIFQLEDE